MAESFLFNIAERVLAKLANRAIQEVGLAWIVESDLEKLQETLTSIKAVLMDAERQQHHNKELQLCLGKLRDIFYDAEDVLDEFDCVALRKEVSASTKKLVRCFSASCSIPLAFSFKMGHKIREINQRLDSIAVDWRRFNLGEQADNRQVINRETHSFVNSSDVIGRKKDKDNIVNLIKNQSEVGNIPIISIVGIGGLGKTTLAQFVYNDDQITGLFSLRIWVWVSMEFDLAKLLTKIINNITSKKRYDGLPINELKDHLQRLLNGKTFLLVLDDVWNEDRVKWIELRDLLMSTSNFHQSRIIVTTRSSNVVSTMDTVVPYDLKPLTHQDCSSLFKKWAFRDGDEERFPDLMGIGDEIVRKCKGVPLALRTLGCLLFSKTEQREWELIRDNDIWKFEQNENGILSVLQLSYDYLPSHLQRCLTYLSLFAKDHLYDSDYVIQFWMANGLLESPNQNEEYEDVGLRYFKELWLRCFVQDVTDCGSFYLFKIHDLIHDLASNLSQRECLTVNCQMINVVEKVRHLSFSTDSPLGVPQDLKKLKRVRTVVVLPFPFSEEIRSIDESFVNACILNFKYLRVLDLSSTLLEVLPNSISTLKLLRYLDLSFCRRMRKLPNSICKLQSLLTLCLLGVPLIELPENLQILISLRCLEITTDAWFSRDIQPGSWSSLQLLHLYDCNMVESMFGGMQHLRSLRRLVIRYCSRLVSLPTSLKFLTKLEEIEIAGCQNINLSMEPEEGEDEDVQLRLKTLTIWGLEVLEDLPRLLLQGSASTFQIMLIRNCPNFKVLPEWIQNLTSLRRLELQNCPMLSSLPQGLNRLTALKQVKIQECPALS